MLIISGSGSSNFLFCFSNLVIYAQSTSTVTLCQGDYGHRRKQVSAWNVKKQTITTTKTHLSKGPRRGGGGGAGVQGYICTVFVLSSYLSIFEPQGRHFTNFHYISVCMVKRQYAKTPRGMGRLRNVSSIRSSNNHHLQSSDLLLYY